MRTATIAPNPHVIRWAAARSGHSTDSLKKDWPKFDQWLTGEWVPTVKQAQDFAKKVHVPLAELYQSEIPQMGLELPDFRGANLRNSEPSPELYDVVQEMSWRQSWMHDYFEEEDYDPVAFVGSGKDDPSFTGLVKAIREFFQLQVNWSSQASDPAGAFRLLKNAVEAQRISVAVSGVVGDNTHRPLKVEEFRGLVFADELAPLIFVNGVDAPQARSFTLLHELAHLALGKAGVVAPSDDQSACDDIERLCEEVAAEIMVPKQLVRNRWSYDSDPYNEVRKLSRSFKASFPACAIQVKKMGLINQVTLDAILTEHHSQIDGAVKKKGKGGDFYLNKEARLGSVFTDSILIAVKSGDLSYTKAMQLTSTNPKTFSGLFDGAVM